MSGSRDYEELRKTHEQVDAERNSPPPTSELEQSPQRPRQNSEPIDLPPDVRKMDEQQRAQYIQNLRDRGRHEPWEIAHIASKLENQALVDQKAKEQLASIVEDRAKEQPSEDYLPHKDKRDRAFATLKNVDMTDAQRHKMERLLGSVETGRERTIEPDDPTNERDTPGGGRTRSR